MVRESYKLYCNRNKIYQNTKEFNKISIFIEYDVSNKHILKDLWVLRYSENHIRHRCELYKDTGNLEVKTWAIRCPLRVIAR